MDDTSGGLVGMLYLSDPEMQFNIEGSCEQTNELYANVAITLAPGAEPYYGSIYEANDGNVYLEVQQESTRAKLVLQRQ